MSCTAIRQVLLVAEPCPFFSEIEGDNADVIEQWSAQVNMEAEQDAQIDDRAESVNGGSAQSTGKMDPQEPGWTNRY